MASFIPDGYTRDDGFIAGDKPNSKGERLYDDLSFTYRPLSRMEKVLLDAQVKLAYDGTAESEVAAERVATKLMAERILKWDLKSAGVHPVPVSQTSIERMQSTLFDRLYRIVRNDQKSDTKPEEPPPPSDDDMSKNSEAVSG